MPFSSIWSELFTELEIRFNFLNEKLKIDYANLLYKKCKSSNEIVEDLKNNYAKSSKEMII